MYVLDGSNLACIGMTLKREERGADLRKMLVLAREILYREEQFRCYFDPTIPYRVFEDQRNLLDILLNRHTQHFLKTPTRTSADSFLLQFANSIPNSVVISADDYSDHSGFDFVRTQGRQLKPILEPEGINCPSFGVFPIVGLDVFDVYCDILPFL